MLAWYAPCIRGMGLRILRPIPLIGLIAMVAAAPAAAADEVLLRLSTPGGATLESLPVASTAMVASVPRASAEAAPRVHVTRPDEEGVQNVIVELRAPALVRFARGRNPQARAAARRALEDEHRRVVDEIARIEGRAAGAAVRREFFIVFNGVSAGLAPSTIAALRAHPDVAAIHPDPEVEAILDTSVPYVRAPAFWSSHGGFRGAGEVIAVVDTGIDHTHADLGACAAIGPECKVVGGYDFHNDDADPIDDNGHGTHVAATAAGEGTLRGVAPDASLLAYKVLDSYGTGFTSNVIAGIEAAVDPNGDLDTSDHADVINLSLGGPGDPDDPGAQAVDAATALGVIVVAAAGNDAAYFAIGSPGVARTAITVASIDEADGSPAWTNSAGPVTGTLDLKPEVAAPGVSICAARAQGTGLGPECADATHISISGTSMATPHVAGAAALLHGSLPSLSPEDIKSLIVQNGDPGVFDFLQGGATVLDIVEAAAAHTVVSPQTLSFGRDAISLPVWETSRTLTVRNVGANSRSYTLSAEGHYWGLPPGAVIEFSPRTFNLAPGASRDVVISLTVDNAQVPSPPSPPFAYDAQIVLRSAGETQIIPAVFLKTGVLRIHTEPQAWLLYVHDRANLATAQVASPTGPTTELLVSPGTYDIVALFNGNLPTFVVHEGVVVADETDETLRATEAVHTVTLAGRSETGSPLAHNIRAISLYHRSSGLGLSVLSSFTAGPFSLPVSPISDDYDFDLGALAQPAGKSYLVTEALAGVAGDAVLDNTPEELTRGALRYFEDPGETATSIMEFLSIMVGSGLGVGFGGPAVSPVDRDLWFTPAPRADSGMFIQPAVFLGATPPRSHNCPWYQGSTTQGVIEACNPMDRFAPAYETSTGELPLDLGPASFFLKMDAFPGGAFLRPVAAAWTWSFHSPGGDGPEAAGGTVGYRLLSGSSVRASGVLPQSGFGGPFYPFLDLTPAGLYTLETDPLPYWVGGLRATSRVALSFDTTQVDAEPPWLERVEVRSDGALAEVVPVGGAATLEVEVHDEADAGVTLSLARIEGTTAAPIPLADLGGGVFRAVMSDACDQAGPFQALLTATDATGNTLREWLNPAFVCRPGTCGDGVPDVGEACDDGNLEPGDGCNATCSGTETCGDGVLDADESCDDGNQIGDDCCSATCQPETAGALCEDGAFCDGTDRCDAAGSCARHSGSPCAGRPECSQGCDEATDTCEASPAGTACRSDANVCTDDACDGAGNCAHSANTASCDDGVYCNGVDACSGGACAVHGGDPCTTVGECTGACNEAAASCFSSWGTPCTDDGLPCTWDSCNGAGGCAHLPSFPGVLCRDSIDPCDAPEVCSGLDPACPPDTGIADTDGDALCDGLDPCTNVAGAQNFVSPPVATLILAKTFADAVPGNDTLKLSGTFHLPASVAFWQVFPQGAEARLVLRDVLGAPVVDVSVPNEFYSPVTKRGWAQSRNAHKWTWRDRSASPIGGIRALSFQVSGPGADLEGAPVRVTVSSRSGDFPFAETDVAVNASITLGGVPAAAAGRCAESTFVATDCTFGATGTKLTCKR